MRYILTDFCHPHCPNIRHNPLDRRKEPNIQTPLFHAILGADTTQEAILRNDYNDIFCIHTQDRGYLNPKYYIPVN